MSPERDTSPKDDRPMLFVLALEDNPDDAELMREALGERGFCVVMRRVETEEEFKRELAEYCDIVFIDCGLPQYSPKAALEAMRELGVKAPALIVSGTIDDYAALDFICAGAADYVLKDGLGRLGLAVRLALRGSHMTQLNRLQEQQIEVLEELVPPDPKIEALQQKRREILAELDQLEELFEQKQRYRT